MLTIDPKNFRLKLVKAHNQVIGRETVDAMASRTNAIAAINTGFFEIAGSDDGRPSLTLMIDGKLFSLRKQLQSLLIIDQGNIQITKASAKISVEIGDKSIVPNQVNYFSNSKDVTFYNDVWTSTTLTPYTNKEILIDQNRPLRKLAYREEFEGDTERRTAAYSNVREDSSTGSTYKLPLEVKFPKRSNFIVTEISGHGDNQIPQKGFILSFP
ncbi:hypothetical protein RAS_02050 [Rickettsia asiatica]|uniref:Uncharacterized protein n=1 Tax=Rickettsia asiatica TaxID=238800 RepID=A0A510G6P3_9RICK|nr:palindromic element RPE1 domain-containing protein [Rickettsia asiatica]BBJ31096.1 hypothetical protein RAS_02050 [Rickettsia asiatica]